MKAVTSESPHIYWARVRGGSISVWNGTENIKYKSITGRIAGVYFKQDEYNALPYEVALFYLIYDTERWIMSMRVDSQYFRTLCNYLHTAMVDGLLSMPLKFTPGMNEKDGKRYAAVYVSVPNDGPWIRAYFRAGASILPPPNVTELGGRKIYDWTPQNEYYKEWLRTNFAGGFDQEGTKITDIIPAPPPEPSEDPDDLPF